MKRLTITIILSVFASFTIAQYKWQNGDISTKSGNYTVKIEESKSISFKRADYDPRRDLVFGYDFEKGKVEVAIVSAQDYVNVISEAFSRKKLERMVREEKRFSLGITIDEDGNPIDVSFYLRPNTLVTPEELMYIEREILKRVRYVIRREQPFSQPCVYSSIVFIKFKDILNGEIPGLTRSEQLGKEKPEWER